MQIGGPRRIVKLRERAEALGEPDLRLLVELLPAEEDDAILFPGAPDRRERRVIEQHRDVDPAHLDPDGGRERHDIDRGAAH